MKQNIDIVDENLAEASKENDAVEMEEVITEKKPNRFFVFLDKIWKPRSPRKRSVKKIVIYKPKSQFRKFVTLISWILFLFTLGFVFYKGYNFTNTLVTEISRFDAKAAIGTIDEENEKNIYIPSNSTTKQIAKVLMDEGIIVNDTYFWIYSMFMGNEGNYKSGNHVIDASVTYDDGEIDLITAEGYEMLIYILSQNGVPNPTVKLFFTEGLTIGQTVKIFTDKGIADEDEFLNVCNTYDFDYDFIDLIPKDTRRTNRLDGYLFPDTYIFDTTVDESINIEKMLDNFDSKFNETYRAKAAELGYTIDEILIIASLLEKEAATMDERAMIAGVIYNRLKSKDESLQYLQIDATIQYIYINETGAVKEKLTNEDHKILNSYNTYMYAGLTPGPICNPSLSSIAAALYPEVHNYYYYVAKNDGTDAHAYATTLAQHNYNVSIYSK
ncbi:MAG: endolytic transglycosylase MltG [Clostridia bacterium]